jgi:nitronate monooxygenase
MLGADGVLVGSRFIASTEVTAPPNFQQAIIAADGDSTIKTSVIDVARKYDWPGHEFTGRALKTRFVTAWHGREAALASPGTNDIECERYWKAFSAGDVDNTGVFVGEAAGLIGNVQSAGLIVAELVAQAERLLKAGPYGAGLGS